MQNLKKSLYFSCLWVFIFFIPVKWSWAGDLFASHIQCHDGQESVNAQIVNSRSFYSESPVVQGGVLYHVEFSQDRVVRVSDRGVDVVWGKAGCGPAAVAPYQEGLMVACYTSHQLILVSKAGRLLRVWNTPQDTDVAMTPNDMVQDQWGGLYFTSSGEFNHAAHILSEGRVYYLDPYGDIHEVARGIHYSNGIAITSDGRSLLVSEHFENRVLKLSVIHPGVLSGEARVFADLGSLFPIPDFLVPPHLGPYLGPDGIRIQDGIVFIAQYGGSRVLKMTESGQPLGVIQLKSRFPNTTNIWANGDDLYVTAVQDDSHLMEGSVYPAIVVQIRDPKLRERSNLICEIE